MWDEIGQWIGYLAVLACVASFQAKKKPLLLLLQTLSTALLCLHYGCIQAWTGCISNAICLIRNFVYANRDKKVFRHKAWPFVFAGVIVFTGVFSWEGWYSALLLLAVALNSIILSHPDANYIRKGALCTAPMLFIYDYFANSVGGMVYDVLWFISAVVGLLRHNRRTPMKRINKKNA